jgi:phage gp29-like protein
MRELVHPITGVSRAYPDAISAKSVADIQAAPPKPRDTASIMTGIISPPRVAEHSLGLILTPVSPERARAILLAALSGDLWMQYDLFCRMEDSWDRLQKDLNEVRNAVKRLTWTVSPYTDGDNESTDSAEEKADLVRRALKSWEPTVGGLDYGFEDFIYHGMDAMGKGLSVQELRWQMVDGAWLPQAAHFLTPRQYGWNGNGTQLGLLFGPQGTIVYNQSGGMWQPFVQDKFIVGSWYARSGVPAATALLRCLVPYWIGITYGWQWLMQTAQIFGIPFRWASYDTSQPGLKDEVANLLANLGASGYAALPNGVTLNFQEAVSNARDNPQVVVIEMAKEAVDLAILGQKLSGENQPTGLGSGNALLHGQVRQEVLHAAAHWAADLLNYQFVQAVLRMNYGDTSEAPVIAPDLSVDPDPKTLAERDQILLNSTNIEIAKKDFYERHGIRLPAPGEEVITGKAPSAPGQRGAGSREMARSGERGAKSQTPMLRIK